MQKNEFIKNLVNEYLFEDTWEIKENSNAGKNFGSLMKHLSSAISKNYWLNEIYAKNDKFGGENILKAVKDGKIHIHDLSGLTLYCCGYSLRKIILMGVQGVSNIPISKPAKHFSSILNQLSNLITVFQNEITGAVAFSSVDTYLAPFIKEDKLNYDEVKQNLQNFIFSINSNSRIGAEPAFSNITLDLTVPSDMKDKRVLVGGKELDYSYSEVQDEMDMFNKAFSELMLEGDSNGKSFAYPIPTYNIHKDFDWDSPKYEPVFEMAGKYGYPYFANFINSDMKPEDARSMCCRLRLDLRELERRNGGLFGSGESTGSIGVVTLNLPSIANENKLNKSKFLEDIRKYMEISRNSLKIKREFLNEHILKANMIPAFNTYVGTLDNHFSTIGLVGMNEMCQNFFNDREKDILSEDGKKLSLEVLEFMRGVLSDFQEEDETILYNLEATPAESTAYRLAKMDKEKYPDIITQGTDKIPYYTNSCHIPVNKIKNIKDTFDHQEELQVMFTGGTVIHIYLAGSTDKDQAKHIIKTVCENYKQPYVSLSPVIKYCKTHGFKNLTSDKCDVCGEKLKKMQRVTGYIRDVDNFNEGKFQEFTERVQIGGQI